MKPTTKQLLYASASGGLMFFIGYFMLNSNKIVVKKDGPLGTVINVAVNSKKGS